MVIIGAILAICGIAIISHFEKIGSVVTIIGICFLLCSIPFIVHEGNKPKTYEIIKTSCYESYHEEQLIKVEVESSALKGYYFYMYMTPKQFKEYKIQNKQQLKITDRELEAIPRTNKRIY